MIDRRPPLVGALNLIRIDMAITLRLLLWDRGAGDKTQYGYCAIEESFFSGTASSQLDIVKDPALISCEGAGYCSNG